MGYKTWSGGAVPNAHLVGLFNRICKLLYYKIKPVFVFDGGVPHFKQDTINARRRQKRKAKDDAGSIREKMLQNLLEKTALSQALGVQQPDDVNIPPTLNTAFADAKEDMFVLPPMPKEELSDHSSDEDTEFSSAKVDSLCHFECGSNINEVDIDKEDFKSLPPTLRLEILNELQKTRKQSSWAKIHEMPEDHKEFSNFQLQRVLKRHTVTKSLSDAEKELTAPELTFTQLEDIFKTGAITQPGGTDVTVGRRIAGDDVTRVIYIDKNKGNKEQPNSIQNVQCSVDNIKPETVQDKTKQSDEKTLEEMFNSVDKIIFESDSSSIDDNLDEIGFAGSDEDESELSSYVAKSNNDENDLTQEQILQIIKQENVIGSGENASEISAAESVLDADKKSNNRVSSLVLQSNNRNDAETESVCTDNDQSSDSSDDFVDVSTELKEDIFLEKLPAERNVAKENTEKNVHFGTALEITIQPETIKQDDDIFSDIFSTAEPLQSATKMTKEYLESDEKSSLLPLKRNIIVADSHDKKENKMPARSDSREQSNSSSLSATLKTKDISVIYDHRNIEQDSRTTRDSSNREKSYSSSSEHASTTENVPLKRNSINDDEVSDRTEVISRNDGSKLKTHSKSVTGNRTVLNIFSTNAASKPPNSPTASILESKNPDIPRKTENPEMIQLPKVEVKKENEITEKEFPTQKLIDLQTSIDQSQKKLLEERDKQERLGSTITQKMISEVKELLRLFGLPYVVAPMEAEAQCAFMDKISLTEGTITDDSDIWLFGGQKVYKNFFDNKKFVVHFRANDIENFFKLSREQMVQLAMLVGSDYTVGVNGIGPVTGIEILAHFGANEMESAENINNIASALKNFKEWLRNKRDTDTPLAKKLKNVSVSEGFPNVSVINTYLHPTVDESRETFSWKLPDLDQLREYTNIKFGWKETRTDEILSPIIKRLQNRNDQSTLESFFISKIRLPNELPAVSKRVQKAVSKLKNLSNAEARDELLKVLDKKGMGVTKSAGKRKRTATGRNSSKTAVQPPSPAVNSDAKSTTDKSGLLIFSGSHSATSKNDIIPQREKSRSDALKRKAEAISILKSKKKSTTKGKAIKGPARACDIIKSSTTANLSELSSDEDSMAF